MSDKNGNELWDIFLVSPQTGEVTNLTASPDSADEAPAWSPDSRLVAYMTKAKTSPSFEIEIIHIASRRTTHVTRNSPPQLGNASPLWSPDGSRIAFISNISGRYNLWTIPSTGGWPTQLTISNQRQATPT